MTTTHVLTELDERRLARRIRAGLSKVKGKVQLTPDAKDACDTLVLAHRLFAEEKAKQAWRHHRRGYLADQRRVRSFADAVGDAMVCLVACAHTFDPERGSFQAYVADSIWRNLTPHWHHDAAKRTEASDVIMAGLKAEDLDHDDTKAAVCLELLAKLPKTDQLVIELKHGLDGRGERTFREVAELMGLVASTVQRRYTKAMQVLRGLQAESRRAA